MASEWRLSPGRNGASYHVRTLSWDELNHFQRTAELPDPGIMPVKKDIFGFDRGYAPPRRIFKHHERHWPSTSPGRDRLGFPTKRTFPARRLRLVASK